MSLNPLSSKRTSSVSESESDWRDEPIIIHNPSKLPVISEANEEDPTFEIEYDETELGLDDDTQIESGCVVEVNLAASSVKWYTPFLH